MSGKYTKEDLRRNRDEYSKGRGGDLTRYAAMLGDSFSARINWLAQLIGSSHEPSLGYYKENLLKNVIREFIPKRYEVATGFVFFPKYELSNLDEELQAEKPSQDHLHDVSRQMDIIVFDSFNHPVVFRDNDFVIVRPESVYSVVEVKGVLDSEGIDNSLRSFLDYAEKWKACKEFYKSRHLPVLSPPNMFIMAWSVAIDSSGYPKTDGKRLRERIVDFYRADVSKKNLPGLPLLTASYIYNDCEVSAVYNLLSDGVGCDGIGFGYGTARGKLLRYNEKGDPELVGDATIASLLAAIQVSLESPFNPIISYVDQSRRLDILPHKHGGFTCFIDDKESDLVAPKHFED